MKKTVLKFVFYIGVFLALAPVYGLGVAIIEILDGFSMASQTAERDVELDFIDSIKNAIIAIMIILPGYIGAVILLIPLVKWGRVREAAIIRNLLLVTSLLVLLSVPVGTAVGVVVLIALFLTRARFKV